jgi:ankyrin repeat protein
VKSSSFELITRSFSIKPAASMGYKAVVQLLLEKGADVEARTTTRETAVYETALKGHKAVVQLLLEKEANIEARDKTGQTAIYVAASTGHEEIVRLLLEKGADVEAMASGYLRRTARGGRGWARGSGAAAGEGGRG